MLPKKRVCSFPNGLQNSVSNNDHTKVQWMLRCTTHYTALNIKIVRCVFTHVYLNILNTDIPFRKIHSYIYSQLLACYYMTYHFDQLCSYSCYFLRSITLKCLVLVQLWCKKSLLLAYMLCNMTSFCVMLIPAYKNASCASNALFLTKKKKRGGSGSSARKRAVIFFHVWKISQTFQTVPSL